MAITHRAMVFIKKKIPNHLSTPTVTPSVIVKGGNQVMSVRYTLHQPFQ
jgi:hypothetical protein